MTRAGSHGSTLPHVNLRWEPRRCSRRLAIPLPRCAVWAGVIAGGGVDGRAVGEAG